MSQLNTCVKECLQRLIKANQKRSGQKDMDGCWEPTVVKKQDDDDNRKESSVGSSRHEIEENKII